MPRGRPFSRTIFGTSLQNGGMPLEQDKGDSFSIGAWLGGNFVNCQPLLFCLGPLLLSIHLSYSDWNDYPLMQNRPGGWCMARRESKIWYSGQGQGSCCQGPLPCLLAQVDDKREHNWIEAVGQRMNNATLCSAPLKTRYQKGIMSGRVMLLPA